MHRPIYAVQLWSILWFIYALSSAVYCWLESVAKGGRDFIVSSPLFIDGFPFFPVTVSRHETLNGKEVISHFRFPLCSNNRKGQTPLPVKLSPTNRLTLSVVPKTGFLSMQELSANDEWMHIASYIETRDNVASFCVQH